MLSKKNEKFSPRSSHGRHRQFDVFLFTMLITRTNVQGNARLKTYERACEVRDAYEKMAEGSEETPTETKEERAERKRIKKVLVRSKKVSKLLKPLEATAPTDEVTESKEEEGELA